MTIGGNAEVASDLGADDSQERQVINHLENGPTDKGCKIYGTTVSPSWSNHCK
ncbi:MAG: hypothetical protein AAF628_37750 [Planctomycetota bacterium]